MNRETSEFFGCVVHSSAFRRMQDKTQLYYASLGDHLHTRLTHSVEVMTIAQDIAEKIQEWLFAVQMSKKIIYKKQAMKGRNRYIIKKCTIDLNLTQAIALLHDIGHTPFGHVGERTLSKVLSGKEDGFSFALDKHLGEFKHNIHSMYILRCQLKELTKNKTEDEIKQYDIAVWEILDGVCKHTKVHDSDKEKNDPYGIGPIIVNTILNELALDYGYNYTMLNFALSLEGQIVAVADEIAQRISDYDDMIRSGEYELMVNKLKYYNSLLRKRAIKYQEIIQANCIGAQEKELLLEKKKSIENACYFFRHLIKTINSVGHKQHNHINVSIYEETMKKCREMLINDVVNNFIVTWYKNRPFYGVELKNGNVLPNSAIQITDVVPHYRPIIGFGRSGKIISETLKRVSDECGVFSFSIRRSDSCSAKMIQYLYKSYYNNPSLLPDKRIRVIIDNIEEYMKKQSKCKKKELDSVFVALHDIDKRRVLNTIRDMVRRFCCLSTQSVVDKRLLSVVKHIHEIFAREIAYYIAGMTDSYAINEYKKLKRIELQKGN